MRLSDFRARSVVPALLGALALSLAACGGGGSAPQVAELDTTAATTGAATTTAVQRDPKDILVDFTHCLRDQGFDVPDPDFNATPGQTQKRLEAAGIDINSPAFQDAVRKCQPILIGILQSLTPEQQQAFRDTTVKYARCMRSHGIDLPDPDFSRGLGSLFGGGVDTSDPAFEAANKECRKLFQSLGNPFAGG